MGNIWEKIFGYNFPCLCEKGIPNKKCFALLFKHIVKRRQTEKALRESEELLNNIFEKSSVGISCLSLDGKFLRLNKKFCNIVGYSEKELMNRTFQDITYRDDVSDDIANVQQVLKNKLQAYSREKRYIRKDGSIVWVNLTLSMVRKFSGEPRCFMGIVEDISKRKQTEQKFYKLNQDVEQRICQRTERLELANQKLLHLAFSDGLTGLANRRRFDEYFLSEWKRQIRNQTPLSLILCDIDYFKYYNDTYGHQAGDECLQKVAQGIRCAVRRAEDMAARYGGEEFAVVLPNTDEKGAMFIAQAIQEKITQLKIPHSRSSVNKYVTLSIGIASTVPKQGYSPEILLNKTDKALYEVKKMGRNAIITKSFMLPSCDKN